MPSSIRFRLFVTTLLAFTLQPIKMSAFEVQNKSVMAPPPWSDYYWPNSLRAQANRYMLEFAKTRPSVFREVHFGISQFLNEYLTAIRSNSPEIIKYLSISEKLDLLLSNPLSTKSSLIGEFRSLEKDSLGTLNRLRELTILAIEQRAELKKIALLLHNAKIDKVAKDLTKGISPQSQSKIIAIENKVTSLKTDVFQSEERIKKLNHNLRPLRQKYFELIRKLESSSPYTAQSIRLWVEDFDKEHSGLWHGFCGDAANASIMFKQPVHGVRIKYKFGGKVRELEFSPGDIRGLLTRHLCEISKAENLSSAEIIGERCFLSGPLVGDHGIMIPYINGTRLSIRL